MNLVSIIIPAFNAAKHIHGALDAVLAQSCQDFEIIVIDDGSRDETASVVESYLSDPRIRFYRQANHGLPGARTAGAKASHGSFLAGLDADDSLAPNALETMLRAFRTSGAAWLNVGVMKLEGEKRTIRHPTKPAGDLFLAILKDDFITRSPFYPREEFFGIGMYDEEMRNREDWDLNIRMIESGKPFAVVDEPLYFYSRTEGSITTGNRRKLHGYTEKLLRKHHKRLADMGSKEIARIYAKNMWDLARSYAYEVHDLHESLRCAMESLRYDLSIGRLLHPIVHGFGRVSDGKR